MRTAHLIVIATAFAAMVTAYAVHAFDHPSAALHWYIYLPLSVLPAIWSMLGYFATHRGSRGMHLPQLVLSCLILTLSLWALRNSVYEWQYVRNNVGPDGYKVIPGVAAFCCWLLTLPLGLISLLLGMVAHVERLRELQDHEP